MEIVLTQQDIKEALAWTIGCLILGGAAIAWFFLRWGVNQITGYIKALASKVDQMEKHFNDRFLGIDRRVTRIETKVGLDTPMPPLHTANYQGPGRRAEDAPGGE